MNKYPVSPFIATPFTDLGIHIGAKLTEQGIGLKECQRFEMKYLNCVEVYGVEKGFAKCRDILSDFLECLYGEKQVKRIEIMRAEAERQSLRKKPEDFVESPPKELAFPINL